MAFYDLPLHLVPHILRRLDTIQDLGNAVLSHPIFYAAFQCDQQYILHSILVSQMWSQRSTLYYAIAAHEARLVNHASDAEVEAFICGLDFEISRMEAPLLTPGIAAELSKTQIVVNHFTKSFIRQAAPRCRRYLDIRPHAFENAFSGPEIFRIQRAFYRYQVYCNLYFRTANDWAVSGEGRQWRMSHGRRLSKHRKFFRRYSPWENEQVCCILDYLERVLAKSFTKVAKRDPEWSRNQVDWLTCGARNESKQAFLSLGLHFLYNLDNASDYEDRRRILKEGGYGATHLPLKTSIMAAQALERMHPPHYDESTPVHELLETDLQQLESSGPPDTIDEWLSDPSRLWYSAQRDFLLFNYVYDYSNAEARRCGYVFWTMRHPPPDESALQSKLKRLMAITRSKEEDLKSAVMAMNKLWSTRHQEDELLQAGNKTTLADF